MATTYTFQNADGSFDLTKLFEGKSEILERLAGKRVAVKLMQTLSGTTAHDLNFASSNLQDVLKFAVDVPPVRTGEAVAIIPEGGQPIYLHNLSIEFQRLAKKPDL